MCGICGILNPDIETEKLKPLIEAMCDVIYHRGPDEDGYFIDDEIALGMRRLSIIDLKTGTQPMFNESKSVVVFLNGEIYNFNELRKCLISNGHSFTTRSDTEVIAHLYEEHGEDLFQFLNGMFGLAIWDINNKKLILGRDRLGEKPLFYSFDRKTLIYGSEIKSILCYPKFKKEMDIEGIYHYFTFNYIPAPFTAFQNIFKVLPGEYITYQNKTITKKKYWSPSVDREKYIHDDDEIRERLESEIKKSLSLRLVSDVPIGTFLSGGIDSSTMVAFLSQLSTSQIKTFTIGFDDGPINEIPFAREISKKFETQHHEFTVKPDALKILEKLVWFFDEPFADSSAIPTYFVSNMTSKEVKVAISGDGGDELFGGYSRYRRILYQNFFLKLPAGLRNLLSKKLGDGLPLGSKAKRLLQGLKYTDYQRFSVGAKEDLKKCLLSKEFLYECNKFSSFDISERHHLNSIGLLEKCMFFDLNSYLPDDILMKVDRMSMANSLETRAPFLDHNLVELALRIPAYKKVNLNDSKIVLKKCVSKYLPNKILMKNKTGFSIPFEDWFRRDLREMVVNNLSENKIKNSGILSTKSVNKLVKQHMDNRINHSSILWRIIMFQLWFENWFISNHSDLNNILKAKHLT